MRLRPRGRLPSLLAWGLLVGGVALLITFPEGAAPARFEAVQIPAGILFLLAGLVFGFSHPDGRDWLDGAILGWVPAVAGVVMWVGGEATGTLVLLALMTLPAVLTALGAGVGAVVARGRG